MFIVLPLATGVREITPVAASRVLAQTRAARPPVVATARASAAEPSKERTRFAAPV